MTRPSCGASVSAGGVAPTRGLTPAIPGTGPKRYVYFAVWSDARERVPVIWMTEAEWEKDGRGAWSRAPAATG
jgi:hypothetical protein